MRLAERLRALDRRQQHSRLAFIAAVLKKFGDDQAGQLAALIAYYGFVSLFPLLLVLVTVLGFVAAGRPRRAAAHPRRHARAVPAHLRPAQTAPLTGSPRLAIGLVGSLLAGLGITGATQNAFNRIWSVPFKHRPSFLDARLRGLGMLAILGTLFIVSTIAAGFVGPLKPHGGRVAAGVVVALLVNLALFMAAFKLLTAVELGWRSCCPA